MEFPDGQILIAVLQKLLVTAANVAFVRLLACSQEASSRIR